MINDILVEKYLFKENLSSYDPYDIWKQPLGIKIKQLYYKNRYTGLIPAGVLTLFDLYINNSFRLSYKKQEYPIVRAQAALVLINLYKKEKNKLYLKKAREHIDWLYQNSSQGYSGYCWGTGFKIVISDKLIYDEKIPFSTNIPYILEALHEYYQITEDYKALQVIKSIYKFYENDILILEEDEDILITSYGPFKDRVVTNAVSYTMFAYSIFYNYIDDTNYIQSKINKMYNFINSVQRDDGSWLYSPYDENSFIDCFHSAFILKNIIKTSKNIKINILDEKIVLGYNYIKLHFYSENDGLFKRFSLSNKPSLIKFDLYDNAEMLYLAKLMNDSNMVEKLENIIGKFYGKNSDIYSIIDLFGAKKNKNTLRWAVMPYLLAKSV